MMMTNQRSNFFAFDIGSSKIATVAASINRYTDPKINAQILHHSKGLKSSAIVDVELAEETMINALYKLEKESAQNIKEIHLSLSGSGIKSYYLKKTIKLGNAAISKQDIQRLINQILENFAIEEQEVIYHCPIEFAINDNQFINNPMNLYAKTLSCKLHIIVANSSTLQNLIHCFAKYQVEISSFIPSIYASAISCLNSTEKELGSIVIDIGSETTSVGVFFNQQLVYVNHIAIAGNHITQDIAKMLSINTRTAERLKILWGNASPDSLTKNTIIRLNELETDAFNAHDISITTTELAKIIYHRLVVIFAFIQSQCNKLSMDHIIAQNIVITGGGASLAGIDTLAKKFFQKHIRIAKPNNINGFDGSDNPHIYSTILGMVHSQVMNDDNIMHKYTKTKQHWYTKTFLWLKENI